MPFRNLKLLIILNKALGLISCKLVNGQLRSSSAWNFCYCAIWILFHCSYSTVYYYTRYTASPVEKAKKDFMFSTLRYSAFFVSLLPYNFVAIFWSESFVKVNASLISYISKTVIKCITI